MTTPNLNGRTAIITGGSRGIGLAIAQRLALAGANIVLTSRKQESADEAAEQVGGNAIGVAAHAVDEEAARQCVDLDRKSTRLNSSHYSRSRMPSSA